MVDEVDGTGQPEESLETKVDKLSAAVDARFTVVDKRFAAIDRRFGAVDEAFVEQRQYTEFAFEKLERSMNDQFKGVNAELRVVRSGIARVERKLDQLVDRLSPEPGPKAPAESQ